MPRLNDKIIVKHKDYDLNKVYTITNILYYPDNERYAYNFPDVELDGKEFISYELCKRYKGNI